MYTFLPCSGLIWCVHYGTTNMAPHSILLTTDTTTSSGLTPICPLTPPTSAHAAFSRARVYIQRRAPRHKPTRAESGKGRKKRHTTRETPKRERTSTRRPQANTPHTKRKARESATAQRAEGKGKRAESERHGRPGAASPRKVCGRKHPQHRVREQREHTQVVESTSPYTKRTHTP